MTNKKVIIDKRMRKIEKKRIQDIEESMQTGLLGFVNKRSKNRFG